MEDAIVTLVIQQHVNAGAEGQYEAWLKDIIPAALGFRDHSALHQADRTLAF